METLDSRQMLAADLLYIGDAGNDSVRIFNAATGEHLGALISSGVTGLRGPRGMVVQGNELLVVNQNVNTEFNGEVLSVSLQNPSSYSKRIDSFSNDAPFSPYGIVVKDNVAYIADTVDDGISNSGRIARYDVATGDYMGSLVPTGFQGEFRPRGLVFGPDGGLYVSVASKELSGSSDPPGYILRFDIASGDYRVVAWNNGNEIPQSSEGEAVGLHNPEGIVFGPDGKLYVTTNRVDVATSIDDNTHVVVLDASNGKQIKDVNLNPVPSTKSVTRVFAESILFGPEGKLYIPIAQASRSDDGPFSTWSVAGGVLKYDLGSGALTTLVTPSLYEASLEFPSYATFGLTDPATLVYAPAPVELPESHVADLPHYSSKSFDVRWDVAPGQVGDFTFDIFVATNGGAYVKWLDNTASRKGRFAGQDGSTYDFVSVARGAGGQVEPFSGIPDTTTIARQFPWQNPVNRFDVEGKGAPTRASDALRVINFLTVKGADWVLPEPRASYQPGSGLGFYDVNGDGRVSAQDALNVINELARLNLTSRPVGEQVSGSEANLSTSPSAVLQTAVTFSLPSPVVSLSSERSQEDLVERPETVMPERPRQVSTWDPVSVDAALQSEIDSVRDDDKEDGSLTEQVDRVLTLLGQEPLAP